MAIQLTNFISGKLDNAVFYQRSGTWVVRSLPTVVKQSPNTKKRSKNFGIAATAGRLLRQELGNGIPFPKDKLMQSRFSGAIAKWLGKENANHLMAQQNLPYLIGFSFNTAADFSSRVKLAIEVTRPNQDELLLQWPAFIPTRVFKAPAGTVSVEYSVTAAACSLKLKSKASHRANKIVSCQYNAALVPPQQHTLPIPVGTGSLLLTVASVRFLNAAGQLIDKASFLPAAAIDARYY